MSATTTPRYGYSPGVAFAATRAFADRRVLETTTTATVGTAPTNRITHLLRGLAARRTASFS